MIDGYLGNPKLKRVGQVIQFTKEQQEEFFRCSDDPVYFIKNYVKIVNVDKGLVDFEMWPFQEEMVNTFHKNRFSICKMPRQVGKTTTSVGYMLWCVLFQENFTVGVLANKGTLAREILGRLQYAYEYLPLWLQQGILVWNKGNIELENGSKIYAYATTAAGVRGGTYNLIFLDEFAFVPHNMAQEFFQSTYPVISSGKTTKVIIVSTPNGMNQFYKMWIDAIEKRSSYVPIEVHWSMVPGRDDKWKEETIRNTSEEQFRVEFECEFIGSSHTLISGTKLRMLTYRSPIEEYDGLTIYEHPIRETFDDAGKVKEAPHLYFLMVDPAQGLGLDYSAITIVDVTNIPYKLVAKYRSNTMQPILMPNVIYSLAKRYNDAFVLVEINNNGQQIADILHSDLEYENLVKIENKPRRGQHIAGGFKKNMAFGVKTSESTKKIGCVNLKTLIEGNKLIIEDFDIIAELNTFVQQKNTFAAEEGHHDDLVMSLVLFGWLVSQKYFKENTNTDVRRKLIQEQYAAIEEDLTPVGIIDDGRGDPYFYEDKEVWYDVTNKYFPSKI